jgi:hypothetical protein
LSIVVALLVLAVGYLCGVIGESALFVHYVRVFIKDYGTPLVSCACFLSLSFLRARSVWCCFVT